jgi:signal transduction histidine kinase
LIFYPRLAALINSLLDVTRGGGRPLEVAVERADSDARLTVRDHGIGIAPEAHGRIFGRFERAVSGRSAGGLGLGLWITREFVQALGGTVGFTSEAGKGSTFVVDLPRGRP